MAATTASAQEIVGAQVSRLRKEQGMTQGQLSERMAALGTPLDRAVISRVEDGSRPTQLTEFLGLALALSVPPAQLLCPDGPDARVQLAKKSNARKRGQPEGEAFTGEAIRAWFAGTRPLYVEGVNPDYFLWGKPMDSDALTVALRGLSLQADGTESAEEKLQIAQAGIAMLQGLIPWLEIQAGNTSTGEGK